MPAETTMNEENKIVEYSCKKPVANAMILAGGLGTRMRPITDRMPKPLVKVYGRTLIDHGLDALVRSGISKAVVNVHHFADMMEAHLRERDDIEIEISDEREQLLDSGGGVVKALPLLGDAPFFLLNADSFWVEGYKQNLTAMAELWDSAQMDVLLLLSGMSSAIGYSAKGDFQMDGDGRLIRREEREIAPFAYAGAALFNPEVFANAPRGPFSLNRIFDEAQEKGRLFGSRLDGLWLHVGTPDAIREAEEAIAKSAA